jgi:hypothetical protein
VRKRELLCQFETGERGWLQTRLFYLAVVYTGKAPIEAITAGAVVGTRSISTAHWFASRDTRMSFQELMHVASVLFIEERGSFAEPAQAPGQVYYSGPALRLFYKLQDNFRIACPALHVACAGRFWPPGCFEGHRSPIPLFAGELRRRSP